MDEPTEAIKRKRAWLKLIVEKDLGAEHPYHDNVFLHDEDDHAILAWIDELQRRTTSPSPD